MNKQNNDEQKEIIKEALSEWLDKKFSEFGRWSLMALAAFLLAGLTYMIFWSNGWRHN